MTTRTALVMKTIFGIGANKAINSTLRDDALIEYALQMILNATYIMVMCVIATGNTFVKTPGYHVLVGICIAAVLVYALFVCKSFMKLSVATSVDNAVLREKIHETAEHFGNHTGSISPGLPYLMSLHEVRERAEYGVATEDINKHKKLFIIFNRIITVLFICQSTYALIVSVKDIVSHG